ncbi:unnamed protein product [Peniophora sp. CBMAI 1063]|nr:unnamed protein product [Peniophora sp. CBMAI 1063]
MADPPSTEAPMLPALDFEPSLGRSTHELAVSASTSFVPPGVETDGRIPVSIGTIEHTTAHKRAGTSLLDAVMDAGNAYALPAARSDVLDTVFPDAPQGNVIAHPEPAYTGTFEDRSRPKPLARLQDGGASRAKVAAAQALSI